MKVQVYAYDLTRGMASALSPMLLGYQIEAVWHTGVVLDGRQEVFFGYGIQKARAGATMFGAPARVLDMGESEVTPELVDDLLSDLQPRFRPQDYNLLFHNCNTFSNELVQLLTGESLPDYIMEQAQHLFNTPWGESLMPMIMAMEGVTAGATAQGPAPAPHQGQPQQQQQQQQQPAAAAAAGTSGELAARAASASTAAVEATMQAATLAAGSAQQAAGGSGSAVETGASDGEAAAAGAASAAANAGMAAIVRAAQQEQQQQHVPEAATAPGGSSSSDRAGAERGAAPPADPSSAEAGAAVQKAAEGVAGLQLTADSRAVQQQDLMDCK